MKANNSGYDGGSNYEYADRHESILDLIAAGDTVVMPFDDEPLEVVDVDRRQYASGKKKVDIEVKKPSGSVVEWREHHLENALDAGAELVAVARDGSILRKKAGDEL